MKRYFYSDLNCGLESRTDGNILTFDEAFPISPDGKRHPTRQEIVGTIELLRNSSAMHGGLDETIGVLRRLATVAPED